MPRVRVLLGDPNAGVLETLADMLQPECEIVGTAQNGKALLEQVGRFNPDVVVLEVGMDDMTGFEVLRQLQVMSSGPKCIFLSLYEGVDFVQTALTMGAVAYVFKSSASADLPAAVRRAVL